MIWGREPALIIGAVGALIALAVGFGLDLTPVQTALILAALQAVVAGAIRTQVSPVAMLKQPPTK